MGQQMLSESVFRIQKMAFRIIFGLDYVQYCRNVFRKNGLTLTVSNNYWILQFFLKNPDYLRNSIPQNLPTIVIICTFILNTNFPLLRNNVHTFRPDLTSERSGNERNINIKCFRKNLFYLLIEREPYNIL